MAAVRKVLGGSPVLVERGVVETEAEQIVLAAAELGGLRLARVDLFSDPARTLPDSIVSQAMEFAAERAGGRPLQHLTGFQHFLDHVYSVGPDVLVPRPETEFLVVTAMEHLKRRHGSRGPSTGLEVGLGSGAISIELIAKFQGLRMIASELSAAARARAARNAGAILDDPGRLIIVDPSGPEEVLEPLVRKLSGARADFLISNPPYLTYDDPIDEDVRLHEPALALYAPDSDPLHFYRGIAEGADSVLSPDGMVFLEVASYRAELIRDLFPGGAWETELMKDLAGHERVLVAIRKDGGR